MSEPEETSAQDHHHARVAKMGALRSSGDEPYKLNYPRSHVVADIIAAHAELEAGSESDEKVGVAGRVMVRRRQGKLVFADMRDLSGQIQLFAKADSLADRFEAFSDLDIGDIIGASGKVMRTRRGELSVAVESFELLSKCLRPLPEKWHGLKDVELRYRQRYLDLMTNPDARWIAEARFKVVSTIRELLQTRGFVEVETPMLQPIPGGAIAKPFVTYHEALNMDLYLRIAPELYLKRLVVGGLERVFEINRNFRNEGVSVKYNPEFTMLELYQAFGDYETMAEILESIVKACALSVRGSLKVPWDGGELDLETPFRRARLIDLVREAGADPEGDLIADCERLEVPVDPKWPWGKLLMEIYEKKVEPNLLQPTFVFDFPKEVSPLARTHRTDPRFTEHLDLVMCGMEIGPAYSELTDPIDQRQRFEDQLRQRELGDEEAHLVDEDFLKALEYGLPPCGGLGLGIDRLAMVMTDSRSIREVILFPALRSL